MNSFKSEMPSVSPEVTFIDDLVSNIEGGKIVLPEFQRPYVWKKEDIKNLFDSIYKGYPIGSVLLWDGGGKKIPFQNNIGGRAIDATKEKYYIVDGQQRLTTLFCCLSDDVSDEDGKWDLYFNLKDEVFTHTINRNVPLGHYINVRSIRKTTSFLREARRLSEETDNNSFVEKAEYLADKIRKYKMAIIKLDGGTVSQVVQVFSRLNSLGKSIKEHDLVYALAYTDSDQNRVNHFINKVRGCFAEYIDVDQMNNDVYLQLIKSAIGFEIYDKNREKLVERLNEIDKNESYRLGDIIEALEQTLKFMVNHLGINSISRLPYVNHLFMIFHFFHSGVQNSTVEDMTRWLFVFSMFGIGNDSPSKRERIINFFREGMPHDKVDNQLMKIFEENDKPFIPEKFSAGSAFAKTLALTMNFLINERFKDKELSFNIRDFSIYPPANMFGANFSDHVGNKVFYKSNNDKDANGVAYEIIDDFLVNYESKFKSADKEALIHARGKYIMKIYYDFAQKNIDELKVSLGM